jgi:hypothetical protein
MPLKMSRVALASIAFQQMRKFLDSPRGKQFVAQAKEKANDPATRARVNDVVSKMGTKATQL